MKENRIGCSGFVYSEWKGKFYPTELPRAEWLEHYSSKFNSVELNSTFYRFPTVKTLKKSYNATPRNFKFSVKAQKIITHTLKMKDAKEKVDTFIKIAEDGLEDKLGCILFQLPPSFKYNEENLNNILESVPHLPSSVIEFRNPSWWNEEVYKALEDQNITFCNNDYPGMPEKIVPTRQRFYMRFHGKPVLYKSEYTLPQLKRFVKEVPADCRERYVYFNNTWFLAAIANAMSVRELME
jgi:uncharacterized protein YecE (DUF72 family)